MSWKLILSDYPESLFRDSSALLALALLERYGAQTEDELAGYAKTSSARVIQSVLALHRDGCVQHTRHHVCLTERGRVFIDRLSLQNEIVDDLLGSMRISVDEQAPIREVLLRYRAKSYLSYANSITAIRNWRVVCGESFLPHHKEENAAESGALAILMRDLRRWSLTDAETSNVPRLVVLGLGGSGKTSALSEAMHTAFKWIHVYDELGNSEKPLNRLRELHSPCLKVFCAYESTRDFEDWNTWMDDWTIPEGKWRATVRTCRSAEDFVSRKIVRHELDHRARPRPRVSLARFEGDLASLMRQSFGTVLTDFLFAKSISDLASRTKTDEAKVQQVLESVERRCHQLLQERNVTAESIVEQSRSAQGPVDCDKEVPVTGAR